jgi:hypothetical protein
LKHHNLASSIAVLWCASFGAAAENQSPAPAPAQVTATPLKPVSTARISQRGNVTGWVPPTQCDQDANVYFLLAPHATPGEVEEAARSGRDLPLNPREVLRIDADGKNTTRFDPAASPKLMGAKTVKTLGIAVDAHGTVYTLVWATRSAVGGESDEGVQYIVSFNEKGEYRSQVEVDWREILVHQFEVFGSGQFLLRGRRTHTPETRLAILSGDGSSLRDVVGWSGHPTEPLDGALGPNTPRFNQMVRGEDGRIYVAQEGQDDVVVYAFGPIGDTEAVLKIQPMPRNRQLLGFRSAGNRFAAMYLEAGEQPDGLNGERSGRVWIAVYSNVDEGGPHSVYGPAPALPTCYQHTESGDRFTFLVDGEQLITMSP